jgi:hypothetical protein
MGLSLWTWPQVKASADFMIIHQRRQKGLQTFLPIVEGRPFLVQQPDGSVKQGASMSGDSIAINADGMHYITAH